MPHEPKKRHSRQRQGKRRASISLKPTQTIACKNCGARQFPHTICDQCGFYRGVLIKAPKNPKNPASA